MVSVTCHPRVFSLTLVLYMCSCFTAYIQDEPEPQPRLRPGPAHSASSGVRVLQGELASLLQYVCFSFITVARGTWRGLEWLLPPPVENWGQTWYWNLRRWRVWFQNAWFKKTIFELYFIQCLSTFNCVIFHIKKSDKSSCIDPLICLVNKIKRFLKNQ